MKPGGKNVTHVTFEASMPAATPLCCAVCASGLSVPPTAVLISFIFEPRNSKMALFVPENCPRKSKRGLFVTFNDNLYLRNRKLLLRRCMLLPGNLLWCNLLPRSLPRGKLRVRRRMLPRGRLQPRKLHRRSCSVPSSNLRRRRRRDGPRFLRVGNLLCRMVAGNVTENTLSGLDTGPRPG